MTKPLTVWITTNCGKFFQEEAGGEGDNRGRDGWMASLTQWTWVWVNSGSWWWAGRPGVLQFMGSQRVGHDWVTELNITSEGVLGNLDQTFCTLCPPPQQHLTAELASGLTTPPPTPAILGLQSHHSSSGAPVRQLQILGFLIAHPHTPPTPPLHPLALLLWEGS